MSSQEYNWNYVAFEMSPTSKYSNLYSNQPRIYMFEGAATIDLALLIISLVLSLYWLITLIKSETSITKALITITVTQILLNLMVRVFKSALLLLVQYPQLSWLFIATSVETTFHYTLYLQYTSSVLLYVLFRENNTSNPWTLFYYMPSLIVSLVIATLNVNFNSLLYSIPFFFYVVFYVGMAGSNVVILVAIFTSCTKFAREKLGIRCRLFSFVLIAAPPVLFNTVITIMDLLFMVVGISEQFPIPYIWMTSYRYKAFEATPVFILIAFFALLPDLKRWPAATTSTAEVTAIVTEPPTSTSSGVKASVIQTSEPSVPIPNLIERPVSSQQQQTTYPAYGSLVVHIQPFRN